VVAQPRSRSGPDAPRPYRAGVPARTEVRQAELLIALSGATDLGYGQPLQDGLRVCLLALWLAEELGVSEEQARRVHALALVRHIGCVANADEVAAVAGDEIALREPTARMDLARPATMVPHMLRHVARTRPPVERPTAPMRLAAGVGTILATLPAVCEVAELLGERLGVSPAVRADIVAYEERWDGRGLPGELKGEGLPVPVQIVEAAEAAESFWRVAGEETARTMLRRRAGSILAPRAASLLSRRLGDWHPELERASLREEVLRREPRPLGDARRGRSRAHARGVRRLRGPALDLAGRSLPRRGRAGRRGGGSALGWRPRTSRRCAARRSCTTWVVRAWRGRRRSRAA
jgi:hypothetical protein